MKFLSLKKYIYFLNFYSVVRKFVKKPFINFFKLYDWEIKILSTYIEKKYSNL